MNGLPAPELIDEWIRRAEDDETNCRSILRHKDGTPAGVCFLAQQMAEKLLKVFLLEKTTTYPHIHDLVELAHVADDAAPGIVEQLKEHVIRLQPYYVSTRYPADIPLEEFTWTMAEEALYSALEIKRLTGLETKK